MAIDEVGCVRGKENNRTEKIVKLANTLHRYAAQDPLSFCPIFKEGGRDRCEGENRSDSIDVNSTRAPFNRKRSGKLIYGALTRCKAASSIRPWKLRTEEILIIFPLPCSSMNRPTCLQQRNTDFRLTSTTLCQASVSNSAIG